MKDSKKSDEMGRWLMVEIGFDLGEVTEVNLVKSEADLRMCLEAIVSQVQERCRVVNSGVFKLSRGCDVFEKKLAKTGVPTAKIEAFNFGGRDFFNVGRYVAPAGPKIIAGVAKAFGNLLIKIGIESEKLFLNR